MTMELRIYLLPHLLEKSLLRWKHLLQRRCLMRKRRSFQFLLLLLLLLQRKT
jgi:hypothetical protein